jgi:malate permease and related proteins
VILALVVLGTGWELPKFLGNTLHLLGGLTIPLMLLTLGISLATLKVTRLKRNLLLSLLRLGGGAIIGFGVGSLFGAGEMAAGVLVIQSAMPVAVFSFLFAQYFAREPADVAAMVVLSTLLSFLSLPLLLYFVL